MCVSTYTMMRSALRSIVPQRCQAASHTLGSWTTSIRSQTPASGRTRHRRCGLLRDRAKHGDLRTAAAAKTRFDVKPPSFKAMS